MKRPIILLTLLLFWVSFWVFPQGSENGPIAVSPGSETEITTVSQTCPTFSWSSVDQAVSYQIAIFQSADGNLLSYEDMTSLSSPLIKKDISGPALSWTLSVEESLQRGNIYIWYVQAQDSVGNTLGQWSSGRVFKMEQEVAFAGIEGRLGEILNSYGVSDQVITNTMKDLKNEVKNGGGQRVVGNTVPEQSGVKALEGTRNTFYGINAGLNTTGLYNCFIGSSAGVLNTTGEGNSFIGYQAGYYNTTGRVNSFFGDQAGCQNTSGYYNTILGYAAGYANTTGKSNSFLGSGAGRYNTSGDNNTYLGFFAGFVNTSGSGNIFLGYESGWYETGSNKLYIANSDTSSPLIYGEFDNSILTVNGKLGINTKTPGYTIEAQTTGSNACLVVKRTDGATNYINATATHSNFGSTTNHPLRLVVNSTWKMMLNPDSSLSMANGASCTTGGVWTNASSRALKENIHVLDVNKAMTTLAGLTPVTYNYKSDKSDQYVGFIAEDVPDLVATADRKGLSPMDITAVLTKVVQEQQHMIQNLKKENQAYKKIIADIQNRMARLEKK